ncbi:unnamed protein product [Arabidopsis thaliana]|uniref:Synergin gamma C-terminal domain-containing protein n=2 Tax=Arabidopsis TaxID=3701 RepID=A0A654EIJ3_ARATH|nr:hypothetical protein ISN44_As01g045920 [Arabidopsis suecica]VYS49133.1 unnamed protein product [Arabidopsis thaliana]
MNGLDFFFSPSPIVDTSTGNNGGDDDWGDFVDSSDAFDSDRNGADSSHNRIESEKKSQANWVTSRGPVPLSVFGEEEEDDTESSASVPSFGFSFDSFSSKRNDSNGSVNRVVDSNTNHTVEISGLIPNLYRKNGHSDNNHGNSGGFNVDLSSSNRKIENSAVSLETNPLNLGTERSVKASNVLNSSTIEVTLDPNYSDLGFADKSDDDLDGWEFKTAESMFGTLGGSYKEEREKAVQNTADVSSGVWSSPAINGTGPNFDTAKVDAVKLVAERENGDDDPWDNGGWEFKVAEAKEPKRDLTNKESNGWGFGFGFEPVSKLETTNSFQSSVEKETKKMENGSISFPSNGDVNSGGTSWAFKQPSLEIGNEKEEKEVQTGKPKGVLPLSFFEDEKSETSDTLVHEDNFVLASDFPVREKTKAPSPTVSISDLISRLYSQVEEKNAVNILENSATASNEVNGEDDSWEFQGPKMPITDSGIAEGADDFDSTWEFQGPSPALKMSDVTEVVDEFDDDSWEFQGPTQPVKDSMSRIGDNGSWEYKHSSVENEVGNQSSVPNGFGELHDKTVIRIEPNDYQDLFHKLKIELYHIALYHLEKLKEARDKAADSDEVQKCDSEIEDLQNLLNNDVLISGVNLESLQPGSSGMTELYKALQEPKFRELDSEDLLTERLLSAEKDWKSTIELLKHATLTLKIINLGSLEQQSKYASTWFEISSTCAQELRHAASIWKQVIKNDVQEEILSKPQGKSYALSVGEIYRVVKILRASTRLYKPWILLAPTSSNVLAVLDECLKLWLSSGLVEALLNSHDDSADQLLESIKYINEVDAFTLYTCITSATSPTCYISGLNTDIVPGIKTVEWNGEHYLLPLANIWANLISRDPPNLPGHHFPIVS